MNRLLTLLDHLSNLLFTRIEKNTEVSTDRLVLLRIFFGLFLLLFNTPHYGWIAEVPPTFFFPPILSLAALFSGFPAGWLFKALDCVIPLLLLAVTLGIRARIAGIILFALCLFGNSFRYSMGKIDHDILLWVTLLCCSFTNWGTKSALLPDVVIDHRVQKRSVAILGFCLAFGMFTAGLEKLIFWVDADLTTSGALAWFHAGYFSMGTTRLLADQFFHIPALFLELGDYSAVFLECCAFLFLLAGRRYWTLWLIGAAFFHLLNTLFLNIPFYLHFVVYGIFLLGPLLEKVATHLRKLFSQKTLSITGCLAVVLLTATHLYQSFRGYKPLAISFYSPSMPVWLQCIIASTPWVILMAIGFYTLFTSEKENHRQEIHQADPSISF